LPSWSGEKSGGNMADGWTVSVLAGSGNSAHSDAVTARLQS
jgi:hypothetical protein